MLKNHSGKSHLFSESNPENTSQVTLEQDLEGRIPCFLVGAKNKKKDVEI